MKIREREESRAKGTILALSTSPLPVGDQITDGPGFRMWNLLRELAKDHSIHVLSLYESFHQREPVPGVQVTPEGFQVEFPSHRPHTVQRRIHEIAPNVLYVPWQCTLFLGSINSNIPTILDYVGPGLLEEFVAKGRIRSEYVELFLESFGRGDFVITTTQRERYYVLGLMAASKRLCLPIFGRTDSLVEVVPMTPPVEPPTLPQRSRLTPDTDLIVLLAGAFLPWYDYSQIVEAVSTLDSRVASRIRIRVLGGNPRMPELAKKVEWTLTSGKNASVFEFLGLVPFHQREKYYRDADVALAIGPKSVEDDLSARTRVVDYLWSRLPILSPGRDEYSSTILDGGAGFRYTSSQELARWLARFVEDPAILSMARSRIPKLLEGPFDPSRAAMPLRGFLQAPRVLPRQVTRRDDLRMAALWMRDLLISLRTYPET